MGIKIFCLKKNLFSLEIACTHKLFLQGNNQKLKRNIQTDWLLKSELHSRDLNIRPHLLSEAVIANKCEDIH